MEQLKVKKKDTIISNVVIFLALSFLFLFIQHAYRHHISPFSFVYLRKGLELFWYVALTLILSSILIWRHHPYSILFYKISIFVVGFKVLEGLFIEFNKVIVIALFFYVTISYFLYQILSYYMSLASINANYDPNDLFGPLLKTIYCKVGNEEFELKGHLTNWDKEGCFIKLDEARKIPDKVDVTIFFADRQFVQEGEVVSSSLDLTGVGIKFQDTPKDLSVFNWSEFMEIVHELGFQPERLR